MSYILNDRVDGDIDRQHWASVCWTWRADIGTEVADELHDDWGASL